MGGGDRLGQSEEEGFFRPKPRVRREREKLNTSLTLQVLMSFVPHFTKRLDSFHWGRGNIIIIAVLN